MIARDDERRKGNISFALGPDASRTPEAGQARDRLLEWIRREEGRLARQIRELCWDGGTKYWLDVEGERISHEVLLAPLEFAQ